MSEVGAMFDEFVQSGLIDDADVTIKSARFATWDYKGKIRQPVLALRLDLEDAEGNVHDDYLSAGELKFFVPSSDGKKAIPVGTQQKLNINTNAAAFIISLMNADTKGEMAAKLKSGDDISVLDGLKCHIIRVDQPKRAGIIAATPELEAGQTKRPAQQLQINKVLAYPWAAQNGTGAQAAAPKAAPAAAPAAPAAAAPAAGNEELEATTAGILIGIITANGGSIKKTAVAGKAFGNEDVKKMAPAEKNALLGLVTKDEFLGGAIAQAMGIAYDKATGMLTMAG